MRKILVAITLVVILFYPSYLFSRRPKDIKVKIDFENSKVYVKVIYPTKHPRKDYIRKIEVFTTDEEEPIVRYFFSQTGTTQTTTVSVDDIKNKKSIKIRAYPKRGGFLEKTFDIEKLKNEQKNTTDNSYQE